MLTIAWYARWRCLVELLGYPGYGLWSLVLWDSLRVGVMN